MLQVITQLPYRPAKSQSDETEVQENSEHTNILRALDLGSLH